MKTRKVFKITFYSAVQNFINTPSVLSYYLWHKRNLKMSPNGWTLIDKVDKHMLCSSTTLCKHTRKLKIYRSTFCCLFWFSWGNITPVRHSLFTTGPWIAEWKYRSCGYFESPCTLAYRTSVIYTRSFDHFICYRSSMLMILWRNG